jgi:ADP-ribose pyrophosphatase
MVEHFKAFSAVFPIILRNNGCNTQILLHRRKNTGYEDGKWDISGSGHVDGGETARMAVIRECEEELGIKVKIDDIEFVHLSHRVGSNDGRTYYDIYFIVKKYDGTPTIMETDKCSELQWFDLDDLPSEIIEVRKIDISNYRKNIAYSEKMGI